MKTKTVVDTSQLLKRMARYEEVTGKTVADSLRRSARLLAVSMAYSTPPFGKNEEAKKMGEKAITKDLLKIFYVMSQENIEKFKDFWGSKKHTFKFGHKGAAPIGDVTHQVLAGSEMKAWHQKHRLPNGRVIHIGGKKELNVSTSTGIRFRDLPGMDVGIVEKQQFDHYLQYVQGRVGMTKAAWAAAALMVKAPVKNSLRGVPAWVRRPVETAPAAVSDEAEGMLPLITMTSKLPWADKALRPSAAQAAMRIARQKFYKSMGTEIHHALKSAHS